MITAPYNFVPLNKEVFYPNWSEEVSHDVPFEDGESGVIDIEVVAKSPIFVRDSENGERFCEYNTQEYIPGSSIKGSIRTVMDVLSYGKLKLQDKRLSYRDLNHPSYKKKAMNGDKIHMGWLHEKDKTWYIDDLGTVTSSSSRIKYFEMEAYLDKALVLQIRGKRQAYEKYLVVKDRKKLETEDGTIVFTGTVGSKKTREFFFPRQIKQKLQVQNNVLKTFKEAYYIDGIEENENWTKLWKNELAKGEKIPVFFQTKKEEGKDVIIHFGLSMLYKLPYENTILDTLKSTQDYQEKKADLGETIFGYVEKDNALKGRVQFSHFMIDKKVILNKKAMLPLSSPRATFFPAYLGQKSKNDKTSNYITYDDKEAVLRGFKFYPPQKNTTFTDEICKTHPKVCTSFYPLGEGSTFRGKVRFFNLKKSELGALVASLTLLEKENCFHKIGMAKPFGFGTVKFSILGIKNIYNKQIEIKEVINTFTKEIKESIGVDLYTDKRVEALIALSSYSIPDEALKYMAIKDFVFAKKPSNKFVLPQVFSLLKNKSNTASQDININDKKPPITPAYSPDIVVYTMQQIAKEVSATVQDVIAFSVGLHFGQLSATKILKPQQAKDLISRMKLSNQTSSITLQTPEQADGISKTKLRKLLMAYWQSEFEIMYHRNQIQEFLSKEGFSTTPVEQRKVYENRQEDESFVRLCELIKLLEFAEISEAEKKRLYEMLVK